MDGVRVFRHRRHFLVIGLVGYAVCAAMFLAWIQDPKGSAYVPMMAIGEGLFLSVSTCVTLYSVARYEFDENGFTVRVLKWSRRIEWGNLAAYKLTGKRNSTVELRDLASKGISVDLSAIEGGLMLSELIAKKVEHYLLKTAPDLALPTRCRLENLQAVFIGCAAMWAFSLSPLLLALMPHKPDELEPVLVCCLLLAAIAALLTVMSTVEVTLFGDRIQRSVCGFKKSIALCDIQRIVIREPLFKPGMPRYTGHLTIHLNTRTIRWALPRRNSEAFVENLREMLSESQTALDADQIARYDLNVRAKNVEAAMGQALHFEPQLKWLGPSLLVLYGGSPLLILISGAYSVRNIPGYEALAWACLVISITFLLWIILGATDLSSTRVTVAPWGLRVKTFLRSKEAHWVEIKTVVIEGSTYVGYSATAKSPHGTLRIAGIENQWFVNDLVAAHAKAHQILIQDRTKKNLTL